jgi:hypothetical protein
MRFRRLAALALAILLMGASYGSPAWHMKADYVEACSCMLFCPCYFNDTAQHPYCEFNMAVVVREGRSGNVDLAGAKYWLTGDLGDKWGTERKAKWVALTYDPATTQAQRDALTPMIVKTYGREWAEVSILEAPIEIKRTKDIAEALLGGGELAYMKLERVPGVDGSGVVLKNVAYFDAAGNDGFEMYKSLDHRANIAGHKFQYSGKNAFLISITSKEAPAHGATGGHAGH